MVGFQEEITDKDFRQSYWLALQFWVQPNRIFPVGVPQASHGKKYISTLARRIHAFNLQFEADRRASVCRMPACPLLLELFLPLNWENDNNSPSVSLTNNDKIYGYLPENRFFHMLNLCLIVAPSYIYTAAKESEP